MLHRMFYGLFFEQAIRVFGFLLSFAAGGRIHPGFGFAVGAMHSRRIAVLGQPFPFPVIGSPKIQEIFVLGLYNVP